MEKAHGSPSPLQSAASNPNCPKAAPVTTDIITHFLFVRLPLWIPLHASVKSTFIPLWKTISTRCRPSWSLGGGAGMSVHSWTPFFFFFFHQTRMCAHIWANPLISPPGLLSISDGSRAVGDDDCWQDLDYWGEDDGSSCSDRIAVTPDPLEGLIRLLWKLLLLDLQQPGRYSQERAHAVFLQLPLPSPSTYFSHKHTHTHAPCQTTSYLRFSVNTAWSLWSFQKERLHHIRALICSSGLYLMLQRCELTPTPAIRMKPAVKTRWRPILLPCTDLQRTARARVAELLKQRQCADVNDAGLINAS